MSTTRDTPADPLAGIPDNSSSTRLPQIPVDIGRPENCLYPVEAPQDFDYRIIQRNNRARRIVNGGV